MSAVSVRPRLPQQRLMGCDVARLLSSVLVVFCAAIPTTQSPGDTPTVAKPLMRTIPALHEIYEGTLVKISCRLPGHDLEAIWTVMAARGGHTVSRRLSETTDLLPTATIATVTFWAKPELNNTVVACHLNDKESKRQLATQVIGPVIIKKRTGLHLLAVYSEPSSDIPSFKWSHCQYCGHPTAEQRLTLSLHQRSFTASCRHRFSANETLTLARDGVDLRVWSSSSFPYFSDSDYGYHVRPVHASDSGSYQCRTSNGQLSNTLVVHVNPHPATIPFDSGQVDVWERGEQYVRVNLQQPHHGNASLVECRNPSGQVLPLEAVGISQLQGQSALVHVNQSGRYTCTTAAASAALFEYHSTPHAFFRKMDHTHLSIDVRIHKAPFIVEPMTRVKACKNEPLNVTCAFVASPWGLNISWTLYAERTTHDTERLPEPAFTMYSVLSSEWPDWQSRNDPESGLQLTHTVTGALGGVYSATLQLPPMQVWYVGVYTATVTNQVGAATCTTRVYVSDAPDHTCPPLKAMGEDLYLGGGRDMAPHVLRRMRSKSVD